MRALPIVILAGKCDSHRHSSTRFSNRLEIIYSVKTIYRNVSSFIILLSEKGLTAFNNNNYDIFAPVISMKWRNEELKNWITKVYQINVSSCDKQFYVIAELRDFVFKLISTNNLIWTEPLWFNIFLKDTKADFRRWRGVINAEDKHFRNNIFSINKTTSLNRYWQL